MTARPRLATASRLLVLLFAGACNQSKAPPSTASGGAGSDAGEAGSGGSGGGGSGGGDAAGGSSGGNAAGGSSGATGGSAGAATSDGAAGLGGANAGAAAGSTASMPPGQCSTAAAGPAPPAGFTKADPIDTHFPFSTHFMGVFSDNPSCIGMTSMSDIDNDGDQDFSSGQRDVGCSGKTNAGAPILWWEYCTPDHWVRHNVGTGYQSQAGGGAGDFDGDGWVDLVAGDSWFKNPGSGVRSAAQWPRFVTGAPGLTEQIAVGDLAGDSRFEVLYVQRSFRPQWWGPGADPTKAWAMGSFLSFAQQQGGSIGDLDGDGKNDIVVGDRWWYRNATGWPAVPIMTSSAFSTVGGADGSSAITAMADVDGDGDLDILVQEHWGTNLGWFENGDGKGTAWVLHMIAGAGGPFAAQTRSILHGVLGYDFDNDGDIDILSTENQGQIWIYENMNGKGLFAEHVVAAGGAHDPRVADVDCDGDLDFVGVPWGDLSDGSAGQSETIRSHVYFKNELVERGGPAVFARPKGEVWNVPNKGACRR
jgi:hypothetical protein